MRGKRRRGEQTLTEAALRRLAEDRKLSSTVGTHSVLSGICTVRQLCELCEFLACEIQEAKRLGGPSDARA